MKNKQINKQQLIAQLWTKIIYTNYYTCPCPILWALHITTNNKTKCFNINKLVNKTNNEMFL